MINTTASVELLIRNEYLFRACTFLKLLQKILLQTATFFRKGTFLGRAVS